MFCIFKKFIDVFLESCLVSFCIIVFRYLHSIRKGFTFKRHIMVIALCVYFSASGTAIAEPSTIKEIFLVPRQEISEFLDSSLQGWEFGSKKIINILWPINGIWVNIPQLLDNNIPEFLRGICKSVFSIISSSEPSNENGEENGTNNGEDSFHVFGLPWWVWFIILSPFFFTQRQGHRCADLSRIRWTGLLAVILSYSVSGAMSAPFGQEIVPPSILAFLKNALSRKGSKTGPPPNVL